MTPTRTEVRRNRKARTIRETPGDRVFLIFVYAFLGVVLAAVLYPLVYIVSASISSPSAVVSGEVWLWPVRPTLLAYDAVFHYPAIWRGYVNSLIYAGGGAILSTALTVMFAYPISRGNLRGRRVLVWMLLFAFMFDGGLIPFYLVVKDLGLLDTRLAVIVPSALNVFWIFIAKAYFQSNVPSELYDAARVDGCGELRFLWKIVLPLSKPLLAVIALLAAVTQWNSYFNALIFLDDPKLYPLQLILREVLVQNSLRASSLTLDPHQLQALLALKTLLKYSVIVVASVPMLLIYPLAQKYFVKGTMIGSLKE